MQYDKDHQSRDVIDDRDRSTPRMASGGGSLALTLLQLGARFGWKGIAVALLAIFGLFAVQSMSSGLLGGSAPTGASDNDEKLKFVSFVLDDVQSTWDRLQPGYHHAQLVLYRGGHTTACGFGESATGPFYCPPDRKVYIDLDFYRELRDRFQAPGDFAQAYVIAHEVGHHVQNLLGTSEKVQRARQAADEVQSNALSVRLELQADCYAGVWANRTEQAQPILQQGDVEEALADAAAIGDDRLQQQGRGYVTPDSFTHGSSAQRVQWFRRGLETGDPAQCDTFTADGA